MVSDRTTSITSHPLPFAPHSDGDPGFSLTVETLINHEDAPLENVVTEKTEILADL